MYLVMLRQRRGDQCVLRDVVGLYDTEKAAMLAALAVHCETWDKPKSLRELADEILDVNTPPKYSPHRDKLNALPGVLAKHGFDAWYAENQFWVTLVLSDPMDEGEVRPFITSVPVKTIGDAATAMAKLNKTI